MQLSEKVIKLKRLKTMIMIKQQKNIIYFQAFGFVIAIVLKNFHSY